MAKTRYARKVSKRKGATKRNGATKRKGATKRRGMKNKGGSRFFEATDLTPKTGRAPPPGSRRTFLGR